jgi:hypothetical protein
LTISLSDTHGPKDGPHLVELRKHQAPVSTLPKCTNCCVVASAGDIGNIQTYSSVYQQSQQPSFPSLIQMIFKASKSSNANFKLAANYVHFYVVAGHLVPK